MANWQYSGDYYVDGVGGDDANAGTSAAPFKTIMAAVAAAEAGGSGYQTIVVGAGYYSERIVASTTTDYLILQADGQVILDGSSVVNSLFYNCRFWQIQDFIIVNVTTALYNGSNSAYHPRFYQCYFKNMTDWHNNISLLSSGQYFFVGCTFDNCKSTNSGANYARNFIFSSCLFINSTPPGFSATGNTFSSNTYFPQTFENCAVHCDNGIIFPYKTTGGITVNSLFSTETPVKVNNATVYSGSGWQDYMDSSTRHITCNVVTMSFNETLSGSDSLTDAQYTIPLSPENSEFVKSFKFQNPFFSNDKNSATAYGYDDSASNPLHTTGGATWTNITSSAVAGFQISASTHPTGTIESAVIDQGSPKIIRGIKTAWASTTPTAVGISVYTSSIDNQLPTRQTFEMRYGNQSDLSSNTYKIFEIGGPMYVDINGTGSGDVDFITGSTIPVTARYLQLKYTLRTDFTGSL